MTDDGDVPVVPIALLKVFLFLVSNGFPLLWADVSSQRLPMLSPASGRSSWPRHLAGRRIAFRTAANRKLVPGQIVTL
jgi:hypothetical protein